MLAGTDYIEFLRKELRQCQTELEDAAKIIAVMYPQVASIYRAAAKRVDAALDQ